MEFLILDKSISRKSGGRWLEIIGIFESPYCIISEKRRLHDLSLSQRWVKDYQFRKTTRPQAELELVIILKIDHNKKINPLEIKRRLRRGEGVPYFHNDSPKWCGAVLLNTTRLELNGTDLGKELFLRRLIREKELGYY